MLIKNSTDLLPREKLDTYMLINNPTQPLAMLLRNMKYQEDHTTIPLCILSGGEHVKVAVIKRDFKLLKLLFSNYDISIFQDNIEHKVKNIKELIGGRISWNG